MDTKKFFIAMTLELAETAIEPQALITWQGEVDVIRGTHQSSVFNQVRDLAVRQAELDPARTSNVVMFTMLPAVVWE